MDDIVLQEHYEDPRLVQITLIGDGSKFIRNEKIYNSFDYKMFLFPTYPNDPKFVAVLEVELEVPKKLDGQPILLRFVEAGFVD